MYVFSFQKGEHIQYLHFSSQVTENCKNVIRDPGNTYSAQHDNLMAKKRIVTHAIFIGTYFNMTKMYIRYFAGVFPKYHALLLVGR
jgi:hypothetical protein